MLAEFSIIPVGKGPGIGEDIAKVLKTVDASGLDYRVNPMGTVVEGTWEDVMELIKKCHRLTLKNTERVVTRITIDDRKGRRKRMDRKILSLEERLHKVLRK